MPGILGRGAGSGPPPPTSENPLPSENRRLGFQGPPGRIHFLGETPEAGLSFLAPIPNDQAVPTRPAPYPGQSSRPPTPQAMPPQPGLPAGPGALSAPGPCNYAPQPGKPRASQHLAVVANFCFKMRDYL